METKAAERELHSIQWKSTFLKELLRMPRQNTRLASQLFTMWKKLMNI